MLRMSCPSDTLLSSSSDKSSKIFILALKMLEKLSRTLVERLTIMRTKMNSWLQRKTRVSSQMTVASIWIFKLLPGVSMQISRLQLE
jgi:hypothetical protein